MKRQPRRGWQKRKNSGDASHGSLICSAHGNFWSSAQGHVVTISSEQCRQVISAAYAEGLESGIQQVMSTLLEGLPGDARQQEVARRLASLPMRMGGSAPERRQRRIGLHGLTRCP